MEKEEKLNLTNEEKLLMKIILDDVRKDIQKENDKKFASAFHSRFPDTPANDIEAHLDALRKSKEE